MDQARNIPRVLALWGALGLLGCVDASPYGGREEPIVGGVPSARESVVALKNDLASGFCTATVVAPRIAVTAKHCVQRPGATGPDEAEHYKIYTGETFDAPEATLEIESLFAPPGVYTSHTTEADGTLYGVDVGIVVLSADSEVATQPIQLEPPSDPLARRFVTVGFGLTENGETESKREVALMANEATTDRIIAGPVVCLGDSGGPLLQEDDVTLVGVTSYGIGACGEGSTAFNTFAGLGWLFEEALEETSSCLSDAHCLTGETCQQSISAIGRCRALADAGSLSDSASDAPDASGKIETKPAFSVAGGACTARAQLSHAWWWVLALFALARTSRSPVASHKATFRRQP